MPASPPELHDIVLPAPVPWWPPTPIWYLLLVLALLLLLALGLRHYRRWRSNRYRREGLRELAALTPRVADEQQRPAALAELNTLLKRVALGGFERERVAALSGEAWLVFLDRTLDRGGFRHGPGRMLADLAYDERLASRLTDQDAEALVQRARRWIRGHHVEAEAS